MEPAFISLAANPDAGRWLAFDAGSGKAVLRTGKVELGQGHLTIAIQIGAQALGLDIGQVIVEAGSTASGPDEGWTSGSLSVEQGGRALGAVCTLAREALASIAAERPGGSADYWNDAAEVLRRTTRAIGKLLKGEIALPVLAGGRWVGEAVPRTDLADRIAGAAFIQDLDFDPMVHARVLRHTHPQARPARVDRAALGALPGISHVVVDGNFIAIAGADESLVVAALPKARQSIEWQVDGEDGLTRYPESFAAPDWGTERSLVPDESHRVEVTLARGFLTSASIATSTAIALWHGAPGEPALRVWTHCQGVFPMRRQLAQAFNLPQETIVVQHVPSAGCYGHNGADDAAFDAALVARTLPGRFIRLAWMREDELACSPMGPAMRVDVLAAADPDGRLTRWCTRIQSGTHAGRPGWSDGVRFLAAGETESPLPAGSLGDLPASMGHGGQRNAWPIYCPELAQVEYTLVPLPFRTSSLRSLGAHANVVAIESAMDELANRTGIDAVEIRLRNLPDERGRRVLRRAAEMAGWAQRAQRSESMGCAFARYKNKAAYMAVIVALDLSLDARVTQVWAAVDAGLVVNPDAARNQIEGGIVQALSWTMHEEVTWDGGGITSTDWDRYPILKFSGAPRLHVQLLPSDAPEPLGVGEAATGPTAAAVANALAAGLGTRLTRMPFTRERIMQALA